MKIRCNMPPWHDPGCPWPHGEVLAEANRLDAAAQRVRMLHATCPAPEMNSRGEPIPAPLRGCGVCHHDSQPWPCATIRALNGEDSGRVAHSASGAGPAAVAAAAGPSDSPTGRRAADQSGSDAPAGARTPAGASPPAGRPVDPARVVPVPACGAGQPGPDNTGGAA